MDAVLEFQSLILNLQKEIILTENVAKTRRRRPCRLVIVLDQALSNLALQAPREPDQSTRVLRKKFLLHPGLVEKTIKRSSEINLPQFPVTSSVLAEPK